METVRSADGTGIAFDRSGAGPPLVFVNGALAGRGAIAPMFPFLEPSFTVVAFDRRGRGASGDTAPYAPEREIEDVAAVVGFVGEPAFLYGHSSGGVLSLKAAAAGVPVRRLVVYEPPFIVDDMRPRPPADLPDQLEALLAAGDADGAVRTFLREGPGLPEPVIEQLATGPEWAGLLALASTAPYDAGITETCELPTDLVADVQVPALVLQGAASPSWMLAGTSALAEALPQGRLVVLEDQGHAGARTAPERVASEITAFLLER